eukprot:6366139-Karenia_brevis.AAC.1
MAYDTLAHDLLRDEKLRTRGIEKSGWEYEMVAGVKEYRGPDKVGANFTLNHNFRAKLVQRQNGQSVIIHNQATPEFDDKLSAYMLKSYNRFVHVIYGDMLRKFSVPEFVPW